MKRVLCLSQSFLHDPLGLLQRVGLSDHVVGLMVEFCLPEGDVPDPLAKSLAHIGLGTAGLVVCLTAQTDGVEPQTFGPAPDSVRRQVVALVRRAPVIGGVAGVQSIPGSSEHWGYFNTVQLSELVPS